MPIFVSETVGPVQWSKHPRKSLCTQFSWGKLEFPHINQPVVLIYYKQETGTNISFLKSQPQREWELIYKEMVLGEGEDEQVWRKMAALLELLAARTGPSLLKKKKTFFSDVLRCHSFWKKNQFVCSFTSKFRRIKKAKARKEHTGARD